MSIGNSCDVTCNHCGYDAKKVLCLVKTDMKDLLTFECKDENCPHCNFEREFSQPEPEESQTDELRHALQLIQNAIEDQNEVIRLKEAWNLLSDHITKIETIQRKKQ